jgi:hypothetical protein
VIASWLLPHSQFVSKPVHRSCEVTVSKQRFVVCVVAACLVATLAPACAAKATGPCRKRVYPREPVLRGGDSRDGLVYLRVAYDHDVEAEHRKAFEGGMALWNAHRYTTGFAFELAPASIIDLRLQKGAPAYVKEERPDGLTVIDTDRMDRTEQVKCAEYVSTGSYIWYSPNILNQLQRPTNWQNDDVEFLLVHDREFAGLAKIYAHELGHALNIGHTTTRSSLMREGDDHKWCRDQGMTVLADMQPADISDARDCAWGVRKNPRTPGAKRRP